MSDGDGGDHGSGTADDSQEAVDEPAAAGSSRPLQLPGPFVIHFRDRATVDPPDVPELPAEPHEQRGDDYVDPSSDLNGGSFAANDMINPTASLEDREIQAAILESLVMNRELLEHQHTQEGNHVQEMGETSAGGIRRIGRPRRGSDSTSSSGEDHGGANHDDATASPLADLIGSRRPSGEQQDAASSSSRAVPVRGRVSRERIERVVAMRRASRLRQELRGE